MSDDLVKRLRSYHHANFAYDDAQEAAARIEALETALLEIEWHDPKSPAAAVARAVLDKDAANVR